MRILIAEDNVVTRTRLREILLSEPGWEVQEADDGKSAWTLLEEGSPAQLLIVDFQMPQWGAVPLIKKLRAEEKYRDIPVVISGSFRDKFELERERDLVVDGRLLKPFHGDRVLDEVRKFAEVIRKKEAEEEARRQAEEAAAAEAKRLAEEAEAKRLAEEAEREAQRQAEEAEREAQRLAIERENEAKLQAEREAKELAETKAREEQEKAEEADRQRARAAAAAAIKEEAERKARELALRSQEPLANPSEVMKKLGVAPQEYVVRLDALLDELSDGVEELRSLMLRGQNTISRDRLQSMKNGCQALGAEPFVRAIESHLLSESGVDRVTSLEDFDRELRRLREARATIQLGNEKTVEVSPDRIVIEEKIPAGKPRLVEIISVTRVEDSVVSFTHQDSAAEIPSISETDSPAPKEIVSYPVLPLKPIPSVEPEENIMTTPSTFAPPDLVQLLPAAEVEKLHLFINAAQEHGYELTPLQAARAVLRSTDPAQVPAIEFYNVLMEDYQASQTS